MFSGEYARSCNSSLLVAYSWSIFTVLQHSPWIVIWLRQFQTVQNYRHASSISLQVFTDGGGFVDFIAPSYPNSPLRSRLLHCSPTFLWRLSAERRRTNNDIRSREAMHRRPWRICYVAPEIFVAPLSQWEANVAVVRRWLANWLCMRRTGYQSATTFVGCGELAGDYKSRAPRTIVITCKFFFNAYTSTNFG